MKDRYTPERGAYDDFIDEYIDDFVKETDEPIMHIGQSYVEKPIKALRCIKCGGTEFNVGNEEYFTGIRCPTCKWEICIHNG